MLPKDRIDYSAIVDRPLSRGPGGARVIVWPIVNVEDWDISRPMPRQVLPPPTGVTTLPDIANWGWHEYGMRIGFWRLKAALEKFGITPSLSINGRVCLTYPRIAEAARDAGWDFMGHGYIQMPTHQMLDQAAVIKETVDAIKACTGKLPSGWLGPGLTETFDSVDLLHAAGIRYVGDWAIDDQPMPIRTATGEMVAMPYPVELNDIPMMAVQYHDAAEMLRRTKDTFDRLYEEGQDRVRVLGIAVHPFLSGVPHRIKYFEEALAYMHGHADVTFMTGVQILDWYQAHRAPA
ncbi:MAG: polysaccharide deacetylase family protein [Pseudomonadota bacterium]